MKTEIIKIDGSEGEGGGQILRTSLSLAMITGKPFHMINIRAGRKKPGLLRQHLTSVKAAAAISGAKITGAEMGSGELKFLPGTVQGGRYQFAIGTAGSTTLVTQTLLPALMLAEHPSTITLEGGTHNMASPPFDFLAECYLPVLKTMGVRVEAEIHRYGFYPAGGGKVVFTITPAKRLKPVDLMTRGKQKKAYAEALFSGLEVSIPKRELKVVGKKMGWPEEVLLLRETHDSVGAGNVVFNKLVFENVTEVVAGFGVRGVRAEAVARNVCDATQVYLNSNAAVGEHLADQLLLPMALAGKGKFTTMEPTPHTLTNRDVIQKFIDCHIDFQKTGDTIWTVSIDRK